MAGELFDNRLPTDEQAGYAGVAAGLVGQECTAWRKSYGATGSLHFGPLIPKAAPRPKSVYKDRGAWVLWLWACAEKLTLPNGERLDSRRDGEEAVLNRMQELVGSKVAGVRLDPETLSLTLKFTPGSILELVTDLDYEGDEEQWDLKLPNGKALTVWNKQRWTLEPEEG